MLAWVRTSSVQGMASMRHRSATQGPQLSSQLHPTPPAHPSPPHHQRLTQPPPATQALSALSLGSDPGLALPQLGSMGMPSLAGAAPLPRAPAATLALAPPIQVPYQPPTLSSISLRGEWAAGGGERARVYGVCGVKVGGHRAEGRGIGLPKVRHLRRLLGVAAGSNCANMLSRKGRGDCLYSSGRSSGSRRKGGTGAQRTAAAALQAAATDLAQCGPLPPQASRPRPTGCGCTSTSPALAPSPACACSSTRPPGSAPAPGEWAGSDRGCKGAAGADDRSWPREPCTPTLAPALCGGATPAWLGRSVVHGTAHRVGARPRGRGRAAASRAGLAANPHCLALPRCAGLSTMRTPAARTARARCSTACASATRCCASRCSRNPGSRRGWAAECSWTARLAAAPRCRPPRRCRPSQPPTGPPWWGSKARCEVSGREERLRGLAQCGPCAGRVGTRRGHACPPEAGAKRGGCSPGVSAALLPRVCSGRARPVSCCRVRRQGPLGRRAE